VAGNDPIKYDQMLETMCDCQFAHVEALFVTNQINQTLQLKAIKEKATNG
jgi:hypothetical protein